jgi:hypothetical protein
MQRKYGKDGFVAMTVSLNVAEDDWAELEKQSRKFLDSRKVTIPNFLLKDDAKVVEENLPIVSYPAAYLFTRQGKWKRFEGYEAEHKNVQNWVEKFLKAK